MPRPSLKKKILDAAVDQLTAKGFGATSVQDITDAAGAPKGSFYNHFKSKEQLATDALALYLANLGGGLEGSSRPPLSRLRSLFESLIAYAEKGRFEHGCLMGGLAAFVDESQPLIHQAVGSAYTDVTSAIAALLGEAKGRGQLAKNANIAELSTVIFDAYEGAFLRARVEGRRRPFDAFLSVIFGQLLPNLAH
ncbi:MAG: TetR family transcriptional regulator C-terminal domain-containing protein [Hyphomicrobium sp.]|uniref:TetR/AcrR family transcriptional regulator n=1 Tax=Hyphomicrobium sp. TaxID=82 RepID=UPI0039E6F352